MIGLKRYAVEIVDHDPSWTVLAVDACQLVRNGCGELLVDVQHVGSTAVPDLPAKPILDIAAAVMTLDSVHELVRRLTRTGYLYKGDYGERRRPPLCRRVGAGHPDDPHARCRT